MYDLPYTSWSRDTKDKNAYIICLTKQKQQNERQPKHHAQLLYMSHHIIIATIIITKIMNEAF